MVPRGPKQIKNRCTHRKWAAERVDEFTGILADNFGAKDATPLGFGDDLNVPVVGVHQDGFSVIVKGITRDEKWRARSVEFALEAADGRELWIGEDDIKEQRPVDRFQFLHTGGMARGEHTLLDRDVDDFGGAGAIAGGVDVRRAGALKAIDDDLTVGADAYASGGEVEAGGIGFATE